VRERRREGGQRDGLERGNRQGRKNTYEEKSGARERGEVKIKRWKESVYVWG